MRGQSWLNRRDEVGTRYVYEHPMQIASLIACELQQKLFFDGSGASGAEDGHGKNDDSLSVSVFS